MKHTDQTAPPDSKRTQQLTQALNEVDRLVQYGCAEVASIAQLALAWLETPDGCRQLEVVARALQSIRGSAEALSDYAGTEARAVGCGFDDPAELRRVEAAQQSRDAGLHLHPFEASAQG